MMTNDAEFAQRALKTLRSEPRIGRQFRPDLIQFEPDGTILIEGEVDTVAQKRLVLERLAALPGINGIVDRLHLRPPVPMSDGGIFSHLRKAFVQETAFASGRIVERRGKGSTWFVVHLNTNLARSSLKLRTAL